MRVLVTGLSGFTGRYLASELTGRGHQVIGLDCDLRNADAVRKNIRIVCPEAVIHLAARTFVADDDIQGFYDVNLMGTRNLLSALCDIEGVNAVIVASSANIYGNQEGMVNETIQPQPANDYAVSKLASEHVAGLFAHRLPLMITRPFNYTGVGQSTHFLIPKILSHIQMQAKEIRLGNIDVKRDFGDVRAVVAAYAGLIEQPSPGAVVNVSTGVLWSLSDVLEIVQSTAGHRLQVEVDPQFIRANEVRQLCGDNTRLRQLLPDWTPIPFEDTLRWMLESFH